MNMGQSDHDARERARAIWGCGAGEEKIPLWLDCDTGRGNSCLPFAIAINLEADSSYQGTMYAEIDIVKSKADKL
jgi:hypothetical protein